MKTIPGLLACLLLAVAASAAESRRTPTVAAVNKVLPSVVNIATETVVEVRDPFTDMLRRFWGDYYGPNPRQTTTSLGSGVIIDAEGYLLTNEHVVRRASKIWVKVGDEEFPAVRIAGDSTSDVALLKIEAPDGKRFSPVAFAHDDDLMLGETVIALGNPFGLGGSISHGILSSKSRRQPLEDQPLEIRDWLQTDAAINPGNSGGPLINLDGELIGLNVAVFREGQGIGFAIPIRRVTESIARFLSPEETSSLWFGARIRPGNTTLEITQVEPSSPAALAGLKKGDDVELLNGHKPASYIDFMRRLLNLGSTDPVKLTVKRDGQPVSVNVRLRPESEFFDNELLNRRMGLKVTPNSPTLSRRLGLPPYRGFVITDVRDDSPASKVGFQPELVIRAVDETVPRDIVEFAKLIHRKNRGEKITLDLVYTERNGRYYMYREGRTAIEVE